MERLQQLVFYRALREDPVLRRKALAGQDASTLADYYACLSEQAFHRGYQGDLLITYLLDALLAADNPFARVASFTPYDELPPQLLHLAEAEIAILQGFAAAPLPDARAEWRELAEHFPPLRHAPNYSVYYRQHLQQLAAAFVGLSARDLARRLADSYYRYGYGELCRYSFFRWQGGGLKGIANADPVSLDLLFAYEAQKQQVLINTAAFFAGRQAHNLLLYGERGTGKSSLIKACVNHFAAQGLKLLSVPRDQLADLTAALECLAGYRQKFVVFLDDFSFEQGEYQYKAVKSMLDGDTGVRPANVVFYATSNRRHLLAERWQDRPQDSDDVYGQDTQAERLALADRFGVSILFLPPDQDRYWRIVKGIASAEGILLTEEQLYEEALLWERHHNSRSGRTARQFIDSLLSKQSGEKDGK